MDTRTITTPVNKHKVIIRTWITGRQRREIDGVALQNLNVSMDMEGKPTIPNIDSTISQKVEDKSIETVVVSVDGSEDKVLNKVLDMHTKDFEFVVVEVSKVIDGLTEEKKS